MAFLEITEPADKRGQRVDILGDELTLGRIEDNDFQIDDGGASSHHCVIKKSGNQYTITDLDSTNGTLVNGEHVSATRLNPKDTITIGSLEIIFDGDDVEPDASLAPTPVPADSAASIAAPRGGTSGIPPAKFTARRKSNNVWLIAGIIAVIVIAAAFVWFAIQLLK